MSAAQSRNEPTPPWRLAPGFVGSAANEGNRDLRGRSGRVADEGGMEIGGTGGGAIRQSGRHSG